MVDVVVVGHLANTDIAIAEALLRNGLDVVVVRETSFGPLDMERLPGTDRAITPERVLKTQGPLWFYRLCLSAKVVVSLTGALPYYLRGLWPLLSVIQFPPFANITTGSDILELAREKGVHGIVYRQSLRRAAFNWVVTLPGALESLRRLKLANACFMRFPMFLAKHEPTSTREGPIMYLHTSHLDWGATDCGEGRVSMKGSDRFLKAFLRAVADGASARCIILDRGPDRHLARQMIDDSGFSNHFEWRQPVSQSEMPKLIASADVVADQFDVGFFGWTAWETMLQAKAVLIHVETLAAELLYDTPPPILSVHTEDDIYQVIMREADRARLQDLGMRARNWVTHNHYSDRDMPEFILRLGLASGNDWSDYAKRAVQRELVSGNLRGEAQL